MEQRASSTEFHIASVVYRCETRHTTERMTMDRSEIRTGIVGLGNIGQYHAERLVDLEVPLVGGMDVATEARTRFARRYDVDVYEDHQALYDTVDAVIITTPNKYHESYAVDAFERDLHVLLEKPLAHSLESAERIAQAARETDSHCMVGFNNRFANTVKIVRNRIDRGELGEVTHVEANYVRRRGIPGRGSWFTRRQIAGGGALIDLASTRLISHSTCSTIPTSRKSLASLAAISARAKSTLTSRCGATTPGRPASTWMTPRARSFAVGTTERSASRLRGQRTGPRPTSSSPAEPSPRRDSTCSMVISDCTRSAQSPPPSRGYNHRDAPERHPSGRAAGVFRGYRSGTQRPRERRPGAVGPARNLSNL